MDKIELLAPGGSKESVYAAVQAGCDAIYMGGSKFSARAYASNFSEEELETIVNYCHLYNVKVYIACNTLIKEEELEEAIEYCEFLYTIGVDAIIIQDMGLSAYVKKMLPDFELHASTQMTIHNGEGALFLRDLGFKRIVLSREMNLKEIKYISTDLGVETEMFVHGALCISYSGQCLMSSIIGGRSGNRGRCAQPCRLPYKLISKNTKESKEGYLLSPKDMCTIGDVKELIDSNTSSLKIEGRMKKPEYVSGVVGSYREAIDSVYEGKVFKENEKREILHQLFNREGFSKAYLYKNEGKDMMAYNFPKNTGVLLGKVNKDFTIKLLKNIRIQDGVRTHKDGFIVTSILKGNEKVESGNSGEVIKLLPTNKYKPGDYIYVMSDNTLLDKLKEGYKNIYGKKIPLDIKVKFAVGNKLYISTNYEGKLFQAYGEVVEISTNRPLEKENLIKNLSKLGDTPFILNKIKFIEFEEGFIRVSSINILRRELIDNIISHINNKHKKIVKNEIREHMKLAARDTNFNEELLVCVNNNSQLKGILSFISERNIDNIAIAVDLFTKNCDIKIKDIKYNKLYVKVPNIIKGEFSKICDIIEENLVSIQGIVTANLGIVNKFKERTKILGDYKLNIFNHESYNFYSNFMDISALSVELNNRELYELGKKAYNSTQVMIYGKYELMVSEYCVIGSTFGGQSSNTICNGICTTDNFILKDRMNEEFIVITDKFCRSHIYNNVPVNLMPHMKDLKNKGIKNYRMDFIDESYEEVKEILQAFINNEPLNNSKVYTKGHYKRGVE